MNRTVRDCIRFYYDSKPSVDYKRLMNEQTQRRRADYMLPSHWERARAAALYAGVPLHEGRSLTARACPTTEAVGLEGC